MAAAELLIAMSTATVGALVRATVQADVPPLASVV
jgi:hypothetical protein